MVGLRSLLDIFIFLILLGLDQGTPKGAPFAWAMSAQRHAVTPPCNEALTGDTAIAVHSVSKLALNRLRAVEYSESAE